MIDQFKGENVTVHRTIIGEKGDEQEVVQITHLDTGKMDNYTFQEWNEIFEVVLMMDSVIQRSKTNAPLHFLMGGMDPSE